MSIRVWCLVPGTERQNLRVVVKLLDLLDVEKLPAALMGSAGRAGRAHEPAGRNGGGHCRNRRRP